MYLSNKFFQKKILEVKISKIFTIASYKKFDSAGIQSYAC
jgi:hypothetical protein